MNVPGSHDPIATPDRHPAVTRSTDHPAVSHYGSTSGLRSGAAMSASGVIAYEGEVGEELDGDFESDESRASGRDAGPQGVIGADADDAPSRRLS